MKTLYIKISATLRCTFFFLILSPVVWAQSPEFPLGFTGNATECYQGSPKTGSVSMPLAVLGSNVLEAFEEGNLVNGNFQKLHDRTPFTNGSVKQYNYSITQSRAFRARIMRTNGTITYSDVRSSTLVSPPEGGTINDGDVSHLYSGSGTLTVAGTSGSLQWQKKTTSSWSDISGETSTTYNYNVTTTTQFRVRARRTPCTDDFSQPTTITINNPGTLTTSVPPQYLVPVEEDLIRFVLSGLAGTVDHWEYFRDGAWVTVNHTDQVYVHRLTVSTKVRAMVDMGPSGIIPTNEITLTMIPYTQHHADPTNGGNYVREQTVAVAGVTDYGNVNALPVTDKHQATVYMDGLGRNVQANAWQASPGQKDIINVTQYDALGRTGSGYLPYASAVADGAYRSNTLGEINAFYASGTPGDKIADGCAYYSSYFEPSPLGRMVTNFRAGHCGMNQSFSYSSNDADAGKVRQFNPDGTSAGWYPADALLMTQASDEDGLKRQSFTDKFGRTIMTRVQLDETIDGVLVPWLETYYIYTDAGALKYIVSPKGVAALAANGWAFTSSIREQYAHEFIYDGRGRVVEKKVPGQDWMYYCYDRLDRLVLVQDAHTRSENKWVYIKYDRKGRPVQQGLYTNTTYTTRADLQVNVLDPLYAVETDAYFEIDCTTNLTFPTADTEALVNNYYDTYTGPAYAPQGLDGEATPSDPRGMVTRSDRRILGTDTWLTNYFYYDIYGRGIQVRSNNHLQPALNDLATTVYDFEGKVKIVKQHHDAGEGRTTTVISKYVYDHAGRLKRIFQNNNNAMFDQLVAEYEYNELGQLVTKKLHGQTANPVAADPLVGQPGVTYANEIIADEYNNETALIAKTRVRLVSGFSVPSGNAFKARTGLSQQDANAINAASPADFLQNIDYRYHLDGSLLSINNAALDVNPANNDDTDDYFGMEFLYNSTETALGNTSYLNGRISAIKWKGIGKASGADEKSSYKFTYDKSGRLKTATSQVYKGTGWTKETGALNEQMTYDHNGNILTLQRNQRKYEVSASLPGYGNELIDNLTYTYNPSMGDQLMEIADASDKPEGFLNGGNTGDDYTYDVNGNLTSDANKGIDNVIYNFLGKPEAIEFTDGRRIEYVYDAAGTKLSMKVIEGGSIPPFITDYAGGFVYENGTLSFFGSPEGRVVNKDGALEYQYAIADHQGNTRVVFTSAEPEPDISFADFEAETNDDFENYPTGGSRSSWDLFNSTEPAPPATRSQLLNAGYNSQVGVSKSFKVYPGDKVKIEAYAKYYNGNSGTANLSGFASALTAAFGLSPTDLGEAALAYNSLDAYGAIVASGDGPGENTYPKAFVNILLFDKDHNFLDIAFEQIDGGEQTGTTVKAPHDSMTREVTVKEVGYAYVYISNENHSFVEVYFDDVTITHTPSKVIQYNEYYPFGLQTSNSWTRDDHSNNFLYNQGSELNNTSGWYETMFRNYDPAIGRFTAIDPLATSYAAYSGYHYSGNNPMMMNDPSGASMMSSGPSGTRDGTIEWNEFDFAAYRAHMDWIRSDAYADIQFYSQQGFGSGHVIAATFIDITGKVLHHVDDDDPNIYLVLDPENWEEGDKRGLPIVGIENPEYNYAVGQTISMSNPEHNAGVSVKDSNESWVAGAWKSYWHMWNRMLGTENVHAPGFVIFGNGSEQYGLKPMGEGKIGVWDLSKGTNIMAILDFTTGNSLLDVGGKMIAVYYENPLNDWHGSFFNKTYTWYESRLYPGQGLYFNSTDEHQSNYYYQYKYSNGFHLMERTSIKTPWSKE